MDSCFQLTSKYFAEQFVFFIVHVLCIIPVYRKLYAPRYTQFAENESNLHRHILYL